MNYAEARSKIVAATWPGDLFGSGPDASKIYKNLARAVHPDVVHESDAEALFKRLSALWKAYGEPVTIGSYTLVGLLAEGDMANVYVATNKKGVKCVLKVTRDPADNDLLQHEATILQQLGREGNKKFLAFVPTLYESFAYREEDTNVIRQVNVLAYLDGFHTAEQIHKVYPGGIDPRDMAWMWKRLLMAMAVGHQIGLVHGAVLPAHVMIHPQGHGLVLLDWCYAASEAQNIVAVSNDFRDWYPKEVFAKKEVTPGVDIAMGARVMIYLLGGNPVAGTIPGHIDRKFYAYFNACLLERVALRPQDAVRLIADFNRLIDSLWKREFRQFLLPK